MIESGITILMVACWILGYIARGIVISRQVKQVKRKTVTLELVCPDGFSEWQAYSMPEDLDRLCSVVTYYQKEIKNGYSVKLYVNYFG